MKPQIFDVVDGHIVMVYRADTQLSVRFEPASGVVEFDLAALQIGTLDKAAIVRAQLSPVAAHSLLVALRAVEDRLSELAGSAEKRTTQ